MLVKSARDYLIRAYQSKVALGAFNVFDVELTQSVARAAQATFSPVIIQTEENDLVYCEPEIMSSVVAGIANSVDVPVILHLDHCTNPDLVERCLKSGYASVMFDGSRLPFEENVRLTRSVVRMCRSFGVPVEGELGIITTTAVLESQGSPRNSTDPEAAKEFVEKTGVQSLAPAVGTAHGVYSKLPSIDFSALDKIRELTGIPLVLHGGSGVPQDQVKRCLRSGVAKVNVGTDLRRTFVDTIARQGAQPYVEARRILEIARDAVMEVVENWMRLLMSAQLLRD